MRNVIVQAPNTSWASLCYYSYQQPLTFGRKIIHWKTETLDTFQNLSFRLDIRNFNSLKIVLDQTCVRRIYIRSFFLNFETLLKVFVLELKLMFSWCLLFDRLFFHYLPLLRTRDIYNSQRDFNLKIQS